MKLWDFSLYVVIKTSSISSTSAVDPSVSPRALPVLGKRQLLEFSIKFIFAQSANVIGHTERSTAEVDDMPDVFIST